MSKSMKHVGAFSALAAGVALLPSSTLADGYGSAGVADANVAQYAPTETVWCEALDANIPLALQDEMNCDEGAMGTARSAVADNRVTNRGGLFSFFERFPNERIPRVVSDNDDDDGPRRSKPRPEPQPEPKPEPKPKPKPKPEPKPDKGPKNNNR